jgi:hypothetical protein
MQFIGNSCYHQALIAEGFQVDTCRRKAISARKGFIGRMVLNLDIIRPDQDDTIRLASARKFPALSSCVIHQGFVAAMPTYSETGRTNRIKVLR